MHVDAALPVFARQRSGHIVTVTGSDVAFGGAVYGATQQGVRAFARGSSTGCGRPSSRPAKGTWMDPSSEGQ